MSTDAAILILGLAGGILLVTAGWLLMGRRLGPEEKERARRRIVSARGRLMEAEITDVHGQLIGYTYQVAGVTYHVVQDIAAFADILPRDRNLLLGPATIRYLPANPANSILISETWSGIRMARSAPPKQKGA